MRMEGNVCSGPSDCTSIDINMVCRLGSFVSQGQASLCWSRQRAKDRYKDHIDVQLTRRSVDGNMVMVCQCRRDMRWNERALECQVLSIYVTKVLSVCLSQKMITLPNGLKSSSLAVAIYFSKHSNKKMFSMNCTCQQIYFELMIFFKNIFLILQWIEEKREKVRTKWWKKQPHSNRIATAQQLQTNRIATAQQQQQQHSNRIATTKQLYSNRIATAPQQHSNCIATT